MPELPEVETIRRDLLARVRGRGFTHVWVSPDAPRLVQAASADDFARLLAGKRIEDISRRGKYLVFHLSHGPSGGRTVDGGGRLFLIAHLRMTGALLHRAAGDPPDAYTRAVLSLDDGSELRFADLRKFGALWLMPDAEPVVGALGPEPLDGGFTPDRLRQAIGQRRAPVKSLLLDQRALAGLGNIYADESLFEARIHPQRAAAGLSPSEVRRLHGAIRCVLLDAIGDRGSSYRDYVDAAGNEGKHQLRVKVFRRTGQPCYVCGREVARIKLAGRSTHFCPKCQPARRSAVASNR